MKRVERHSQGTDQPLSIVAGPELHGEVHGIGTLADLLKRAVDNSSYGITFVADNDSEKVLKYSDLFTLAKSRLGVLQEKGLTKGQYVMLVIDNPMELLVTFWACVLGGIIPAPMAYPPSIKSMNSVLQKLSKIWSVLGKPVILGDQLFLESNSMLCELCHADFEIWDITKKIDHVKSGRVTLVLPSAPALIQFSSGSTGVPKGVILTHENLLANLQGIITAANVGENDVYLNWMPFHHDMGLIGFHLTPLACKAEQVHITPVKFVKRPLRWLDLINSKRVTVVGSPNFGYRMVLSRLKKSYSWDLSCLRFIFNGSEPISAKVMNEFIESLAPYGLRPEAMFPVYGMAEACVAVAFPQCGVIPKIHHVNRNHLAVESIATPIEKEKKSAVAFVSEGRPLPGISIRIVGNNGEIVPERTVGEIEIIGPNVTSGYYNNPDATSNAIHDGWLKTGDLGFIDQGTLVVTGRKKDIIFINGQNYYAHDIERMIDDINGVEPGKFVICAWHDESEGVERVCLFSSQRVKDNEVSRFFSEILRNVNEIFGIAIDFVAFVRKIPKTTSGKIQRYELIEEFRRGNCEILLASEVQFSLVNEVNRSEFGANSRTPEELRAVLKSAWGAVLQKDPKSIPEDASFRSLGGTSILAIQLLTELEDSLDTQMGHELLINCSTVNEMAAALSDFFIQSEHINEKEETQFEESIDMQEPIAIVSLSCRFPDADSPESFWNNLIEGHCSISQDLWERPEFVGYFGSSEEHSCMCPSAATINSPYAFDSALFGINDSEAAVMDPQQRISLEMAFELLERAGYTKEFVAKRRIGVFIGASGTPYYEYHANATNRVRLERLESVAALDENERAKLLSEWSDEFGHYHDHPNVMAGNIPNMIASRISHEFALTGPSMVIDTACSSSLVALHLASESIRRGECESAIVGGISLLLTPSPLVYLSSAGALSASGKACVFDENADGFVPGEGGAMVLLKPLSAAMASGDRIFGIIRGSSINNDGPSIGVMAPNPDGQREVIWSVYKKTGIDPSTLQYVEAHGTGTRVGDPSEVRALSRAFQEWDVPSSSIAIGSVKSNIGHLLAAAGMAGLIKVLLALSNRTIPPTLGVSVPNRQIHFEKTPFYPVVQARDMTSLPKTPLCAAINSFGFGGTNCHVLIESPPEVNTKDNEPTKDETATGPFLVCLNAQTEQALQRMTAQLSEVVTQFGGSEMGNICYSYNTSKSRLKYRTYGVGKTWAEIEESINKNMLYPAHASGVEQISLMFSGQGSQYVGMATQLYRKIPIFTQYWDECVQAFIPHLGVNIHELIYGSEASDSVLAQTHITQPATFALEYALGKTLLSLGVKPSFLVGHSIGEWVCVTLADMLDLRDACRIVALRGKVMSEVQTAGSMVAVFVTRERVEELLAPFRERLWVAGYNITHQVVSGHSEAVDEFTYQLDATGVFYRRLNVSHAFHTPLMREAARKFAVEIDGIEFRSPQIPIIANVSGRPYTTTPDRQYWAEHIVAPVQFEDSIRWAMKQGVTKFVEVGPDKALSTMVEGLTSVDPVTVIPVMNRRAQEMPTLLTAVGRLFATGTSIDFSRFYAGNALKRLTLPSYPFERKQFYPTTNIRVKDAIRSDLNTVHVWEWKEKTADRKPDLPQSIIVFLPQGSFPSPLPSEYDFGNSDVYLVRHGSDFSRLGDHECMIDYNNEAHFVRALQCVPSPSRVVMFSDEFGRLELSDETGDLTDVTVIWRRITYVARALLRLCDGGPNYLRLVTRNAVSVLHDEIVHSPLQALEIALVQSIGTEYALFDAAVVDVDFSEYPNPMGILSQVIQETSTSSDRESIVAIRQGKRFLRSLNKWAALSLSVDGVELHDGDTFIITGGLGLIGGAIAKSLARKARINLALIGRTQLPSREFWSEQQIGADVQEKIEQIRSLENLGAQVEYYSADVCNRGRMAEVLEHVRNRFGAIIGVVHAAGSMDANMDKSLDRDFESIHLTFREKVASTQILDQLTRNDALKVFLLISSISATKRAWSSRMSGYAAANLFLDYFVMWRKQTDAPGRSLAVNYSFWEGMGVNKALGATFEQSVVQQIVASHGLEPLNEKEATDALLVIMAEGGPSGVFHVLKKTCSKAVRPRSNIPNIKAASAAVALRPIKQWNKWELQDQVVNLIAADLDVDRTRIDLTQSFDELGMDSVAGVKLISELASILGVELHPTLIFEYQTPEELIDFLLEYINGSLKEQRFDSADVRIVRSNEPDSDDNDIAIVGMAIRVPGAETLDEFWNMLMDGRTAISELPHDRWSEEDIRSIGRDVMHGSITNRGGFLERPYDFDPLFFGMSPKEAMATDPQQRLFLQVAWEAIQSGGYGGMLRPRKTGLYVGCEQNTYMEHFIGYRSFMQLQSRLENQPEWKKLSDKDKQRLLDEISLVLRPGELNSDVVPGNGMNQIATRVSHFLNASGPSLVVNTACSSSLVAIHLACESLRHGEVEMALAGGVNLNLTPAPFIGLSRNGALSPTGECYPFDSRANGIVLGEGCGCLVLKRLRDARRDGDFVHAIIKGSVVNNDGRTQGPTVPRPEGQAEAIREAYARAKIDPKTIGYIETHGTGTPLGDPIEIQSMMLAFGTDTTDSIPIGSVKSTVGHMLAAAGMVSVIKTVLSLQHCLLPPTVNYRSSNPNIKLEQTPFYVVSGTPEVWKAKGEHARRAGVNAFGFGGTNAHIILEEADLKNEDLMIEPKKHCLLLLEGQTPSALQKTADVMRHFIGSNLQIPLPSICHTVNVSQKRMRHRLAVLSRDGAQMCSLLEEGAHTADKKHIWRGMINPHKRTPTVLLLGGMSPFSMIEVQSLVENSKTFSCAYQSIKALFRNPPKDQCSTYSPNDAEVFCIQVALCMMLKEFGVRLHTVSGVGVGALSAAFVSGRVSEDVIARLLDGVTVQVSVDELSSLQIYQDAHLELGPEGLEALKRLGKFPAGFEEDLVNIIAERGHVLYLGSRDISRHESSISAFSADYENPWERVLAIFASLYVNGIEFDPTMGGNEQKVPVPTYPFELREFRIQPYQSEPKLKGLIRIHI